MKHIELNNQIMQKKDGFYDLDKDKEAVKEYMKEVKKNFVYFDTPEQRLNYLIENNYYFNVLDFYTIDQIKEIESVVRSYNFEFSSYMAASKFYREYALQTNDKKKYLEMYEDRIVIVALDLARGNFEFAKKLAISMIEQRLQPATPTFLNAGKARKGEMVSCFLLDMDDSLNSINHVLNMCMQLSKIGGGVAVNLSKLRGRGEAIKGVEGAAKGIMPVLKLMEDAFSYADQMGQRKGSGAGYYNIFGWDIMEFLDSKKINADEKTRLQKLSIGLIIPNKFYELAANDKPHVIFAPYSVYKAYGVHLDDMDMDEMYEVLLTDDRVRKQTVMSARDMLVKIATTQLESGYPYIMNKDNANKVHALKEIGRIKMSNLCTEIFQLQETSTINDFGEEHIINRDISCNLASLNIVNVFNPNKPDDFRGSVHIGMDALTQVSDMTSIKNAPSVKKANEELHSVGLGLMNLHGFFVKNRIPYESEEAKDFVRTFCMMLNYYSIERSMQIAKERGITFRDFEKSDYANGKYFEMYFKEDFSPRTERIKKLFETFNIPSKKDWSKLANEVKNHGLYHAYRLAIAPTQSISYIQNSTSSLMPIVEQIETRTYGNSTTYYPMPYLDQSNIFFYKSAYNMNMMKMIDLIAEAQRHIDQGISTILYVNSDVSTRDLGRYYVYAAKKGLKSLYYTRTRLISVEECTSCAV